MRDEINRRVDIVNFAIENPYLYKDGNVPDFQAIEGKLKDTRAKLQDYVDDLFDSPADSTGPAPFKIEDLPTLPVPLPVIDLPAQIVLEGWYNPPSSLTQTHTMASGPKGKMIQFPRVPMLGLASGMPNVGKISIDLITYELDIRIKCRVRIISNASAVVFSYIASTIEGINGIRALGGGFYGVTFALEGKDTAAYTIFYRALLCSLGRPETSFWSPYVSDGEPIGTMDIVPTGGLGGAWGESPTVVGLEINIAPRV